MTNDQSHSLRCPLPAAVEITAPAGGLLKGKVFSLPDGRDGVSLVDVAAGELVTIEATCPIRESTEYAGGRQIVQSNCGACGNGCSRPIVAEAATDEPPAASLSDQPADQPAEDPPEDPRLDITRPRRKPKRNFLR